MCAGALRQAKCNRRPGRALAIFALTPHAGFDRIAAMAHLESSPQDNRRSARRFARLLVLVAGVTAEGKRFREKCQTIVVNAHGALLYVSERLEHGALVHATSPANEEEMECRVVFLGEISERGQRIGIEFLTPAPHFWGIEFPPETAASPTVH
jgi:hypothetical protein